MKKFISVLLVAVMILILFSTASVAEEIEGIGPFTDVKESAGITRDRIML